MLDWRGILSAHILCMQKESSKLENCEEMHYNVHQKMLHWALYRAVFCSVSLKTELLGVKVTIEFQRQCHKNLIFAQGVNCSGRVVTVNVVILTSKFPIVVSGSKYT
jgi:hypothetical protein